MLVGQPQPMGYSFHIFGGVINSRRCMSVLLHIRREGWFPSCGDH